MDEGFNEYRKLYEERNKLTQNILGVHTKKIDSLVIDIALVKQKIVIYAGVISLVVATGIPLALRYFFKI